MVGIDEESFSKALLMALQKEPIRAALMDINSTSFRNEIVALRKELKAKDKTIAELKDHIATLETETDNLQQYSRRNSLRISGIPESDTEDPVEKSLTLINETMKVKPKIELSDVDRIHRVGAKSANKSRPMLIKFSTYLARKRVMAARKSLNRTQVFLNEDLTRRRSNICWKARQMKKDGRIQGVWTADGNILLKTNSNRVVTITSLEELDKAAMTPRPPSASNTAPPNAAPSKK